MKLEIRFPGLAVKFPSTEPCLRTLVSSTKFEMISLTQFFRVAQLIVTMKGFEINREIASQTYQCLSRVRHFNETCLKATGFEQQTGLIFAETYYEASCEPNFATCNFLLREHGTISGEKESVPRREKFACKNQSMAKLINICQALFCHQCDYYVNRFSHLTAQITLPLSLKHNEQRLQG